jgi:hypothetical protein
MCTTLLYYILSVFVVDSAVDDRGPISKRPQESRRTREKRILHRPEGTFLFIYCASKECLFTAVVYIMYKHTTRHNSNANASDIDEIRWTENHFAK